MRPRHAGRYKRWTDIEEQGGDGSVAVDVDHAQVVRQVALSGAHEEQPFVTHKIRSDERMPMETSDGGHW